MGCHAEKVITERELAIEIRVSESKKEDKKGEDYLYGLKSGPHNNGLNGVLGRIVVSGSVVFNNPHEQVLDTNLCQVGPNISSAAELGTNNITLSPTRGKTHAHASKSGKENVGVGLTKGRKKKTMRVITRMEVEEENVGVKQKTWAPLEEIMENVEVRKKPKLEAEVAAFGKLLATQMGSAAAAV